MNQARNERPGEEREWVDPELEAKKANEAWLRSHHKVVAPLLIGTALAVFILPWVFLSFLGALLVQIGGALAFYLLGKKFTTAFDQKRPF